MAFARYAALVKNLRGVVLADLDEDGVWDSIEWLIRRFRYRDLGLTPYVVRRFNSRLEKYLRGNPFRALTLPVTTLQNLVDSLAECHQSTPYEVVELLVYSSTYISPAMIIGRRYLGDIERISAGAIYTSKELDINSWKLHMRIADYSILDMYEICVSDIIEATTAGAGEETLIRITELRLGRIESDKKRYWRIASDSGRPFLYYVDLLKLVLDCEHLKNIEEDHAAGLAVVPVIQIPPGMR